MQDDDAKCCEGYTPQECTFIKELEELQKSVGYPLKFNTPLKWGDGFKK